jgi:hypothetical protein
MKVIRFVSLSDVWGDLRPTCGSARVNATAWVPAGNPGCHQWQPVWGVFLLLTAWRASAVSTRDLDLAGIQYTKKRSDVTPSSINKGADLRVGVTTNV